VVGLAEVTRHGAPGGGAATVQGKNVQIVR
jgi:hypothetical protein